MVIKIKRSYDKAEAQDGYRILVDRIWPRGISKQKGKIDLWLKEIAPSNELRKWFNHDPEKWNDFQKKYIDELSGKQEEIKILKKKLKEEKIVTLVFAAKNEEYNNAVALQKFLKKK